MLNKSNEINATVLPLQTTGYKSEESRSPEIDKELFFASESISDRILVKIFIFEIVMRIGNIYTFPTTSWPHMRTMDLRYLSQSS